MAAVMTGKKRIRWDEPYLCGMNENNGMKDESDYLKGVGMSDGIPSVPVQTRQEENGENEKVQLIGQRTVCVPGRAVGENAAGLFRAEYAGQRNACRNILVENEVGKRTAPPVHA